MQFKGYTLNSFQVRAIQGIEDGKNVLLSAPTGAGKTLVGEYAIEESVAVGRKVIYTSPIKALSNQKFRDFKEDGIDVGLMTGDLTLNPDAPVVIMTTEIFRNAVFEEPRRFDVVDFVIFDEIHFMDDPERGTVWEESLIFAPEHVRFVGLSATISNLAQFGKWLQSIRPQDLEIIRHEKRPVPLKHQLFHPVPGLFNLAQRKRGAHLIRRQQENERGSRGRHHRYSRRPTRRIRRTGKATQLILNELQSKNLLPVLFFCFSRKECEIKADLNQHRNAIEKDGRQKITSLFKEICDKFELDPDQDPTLKAIYQRASRGVGYHHAGMLPIHKEVVERLFTSGLVKILFTTETFALGINMPARTVVFDSLRKFDGVTFDYMKTRDYLQMAGRAGRQGIDRSGLVISILDDEDIEDAPLSALFGGKSEPITSRFNLSYSTILNLYEHMGADLVSAYDQSFAAFQAQTGSQKNRDRKRGQARAALRAKIAVLIEAGYIDDSKLLPRGKIAQKINGYEIQVTELLFQGVLESMDIHQLACTFAALVHEDRRNDPSGEAGRRMLGPNAQRMATAISRFASLEREAGFKDTIKLPEFGIVPAVDAWSRGVSISKLQKICGNDGGDAVRTMRMAIQMLRQLRTALSGDYSLINTLAESIVCINRDVVDAKRQFELG
ncbi:MAG: DEAD/DEAH box helicase [Planctomycetota bacterium]|jgi:superfamily II RNA helicase|nr:DEAD/DEAH box helicase [Planctomycetota bacterium]